LIHYLKKQINLIDDQMKKLVSIFNSFQSNELIKLRNEVMGLSLDDDESLDSLKLIYNELSENKEILERF
jgi:hypothetical protein